jgi:opacity protein-like surface antigen
LIARVGYHLNSWLAFEFSYDYLWDFEVEESETISGVPKSLKGELDIMTFMLQAKFSKGFLGSDVCEVYAVIGGGVIYTDLDLAATVSGTQSSSTESDTAPCATVGTGIEYFVRDDMSIGLEGNYIWGLGDLDEYKYAKIAFVIAYHY